MTEKNKLNIIIFGAGYVGLSNAVLLAQTHSVCLIDVDENRVNLINQRQSPITDKEIEEYLAEKPLNLTAHLPTEITAWADADFVLIATPTNYDSETNAFDTSSVEKVIEQVLASGSNAAIIIKSTVPVGFTKKIRQKFNAENIIFSPEFLREGKALYDNLYPSRIIVGDNSEAAQQFAAIMQSVALKPDVPIWGCTRLAVMIDCKNEDNPL